MIVGPKYLEKINSRPWPKRMAEFVQKCLREFEGLTIEDVLYECGLSAAQLTNAKNFLLVSLNDQEEASIVVSSHKELKNKYIKYTGNNSINTIEFKKPSSIGFEDGIFNDEEFVLYVPIQEEKLSYALILGYNDKIMPVSELIDFGQIAQSIFLEKFRAQSLRKSLNNARNKFYEILHSVTDAIVIFEDSSQQVWVNSAATGLLSLPKETNSSEQVITAIRRLSSGAENAEAIKHELEDVLSSNQKQIGDWQWYFATPSPKQLHVSLKRISLGEIKGTVWAFKDATHEMKSQLFQTQNQELLSLLSSVLESSLPGVIVFQSVRDQNKNIIDFECISINNAAKKVFGKKSSDLEGKRLRDFFPESLENGVFNEYVNVVETGEPLYQEHLFDQQGGKIWYQALAVNYQDGFILTFSDIKKLKVAEGRLKQNQANLEALIENSTEYKWSLDRNYRITTINSAFKTKVFHETGVKLRVGDVFDFNIFTNHEIPVWREYINRVFQGKRFTKEIKARVFNNEHIFEYTFAPIKDVAEKTTGVAILGRDITNRKKAEREIRQKSQMLNSILQNLPVFIFRLAPGGKIIDLIGAGLKNLKVFPHQLIGKSAYELFPEIENKLTNLKNEKPINFLSKGNIRGKDWYFENYIFPDETATGGVIGFAIDVTELKQIEQELKKAKEAAEQANQAKSYFLANMSHDIRTPVHTILGFARALKNQNLPALSLEYVSYIITSGEIFYRLLDDLLELTKIEEGKLELAEEPFNLQKTITFGLEPYRFQANEKGLGFNLYFDESIPLYFLGDAGKISRIVINLIGNSLKFTREGFIQVKIIGLGFEAKNNYKLKVTVTDTGVGIPKEKQNVIFNSFTQAEPSIYRTFGGSGLGLAIVKELVELMGGEYGVESPVFEENGRAGSTFWFTLNLTVADPLESSIKIHDHEPEINYNNQLKVLLVEDNVINQQLAKVMLSKIGCNYAIADNGHQALEILESEGFDLIFMDVQMPVLNGIDATKKIRESLNPDIPIIGLSANIYKEDIEKCLESGMNDYLGKPFSEKDLQDKLRKWTPVILPEANLKGQSKPSANKVTNLAFLLELYDGDISSVKNMINDFINFHGEVMVQMEEALKAKEYSYFAKLTHKMRSSGKTVGLESLYETLVNLEMDATKGISHEKIKSSFEEVKQTYQQAINELQNFISQS